MRYVILYIIFFSSVVFSLRQQSVGIRGKLMCGDTPAVGIRVKLCDEDDGPDPDDILAEGQTNGQGGFLLQGFERELTNIDPVFKIYHDCDDGIKPGQRRVKFQIPATYITSGPTPKRIFNIGLLNLETIFPQESRNYIS